MRNLIAETLREIMEQYNKFRGMWICEYGNADGFDQWFTQQVKNS